MIIVNARFLTQTITGVQRFAIEISKHLKLMYGDGIRFVSCPGIIHQDLADVLEAEVIGINRSHIWEQLDLYFFLLNKKKPLLISFGSTGPLFYNNQIVTIHDVAFRLYRETFSKSFGIVYNFLIPRLAKRSLHILTVSYSSKKDLIREYNIPASKISVVYNGISAIFQNNKKVEKDLRSRPYILTVSSHHPRKNYIRLIRAFKKLRNSNLDLYVIGNFQKHFNHKQEYKADYNIKFLTNITDQELLEYYQGASLFVFPSLYEGFGIPLIEAMSQNLTCVISDIPVFKEIGDSSVIYVDPLDVNSIVNGLNSGLLNTTKKKYPKLENYSWQKSSVLVKDILDKLSNKD